MYKSGPLRKGNDVLLNFTSRHVPFRALINVERVVTGLSGATRPKVRIIKLLIVAIWKTTHDISPPGLIVENKSTNVIYISGHVWRVRQARNTSYFTLGKNQRPARSQLMHKLTGKKDYVSLAIQKHHIRCLGA